MNNAERPSDELVAKMISLVRDLYADHLKYDMSDRAQDFCVRTAVIVAELPKPIDPDLIEARKLAASLIRHHSPIMAQDIESGYGDHDAPTMQVMAGIKRGRALAKEEAGL